MDKLALQGLGFFSTLLPQPLSRVLEQTTGLLSIIFSPQPLCPTGDPVWEILARTAKLILAALTTSYFDVKVLGLENVPPAGGALVAGNHPSLVDGLLLFNALPRAVRFLVHEDLSRHPLLHWVAEGMGYLSLRQHAVHAAEAALAAGNVVGVFPEGWVWEHGIIRDWKPGAAIMALRSGAPVIPLGISGSDVAWPGATLLPVPAPIALSFGKPLRFPVRDSDPVPEDDIKSVMSILRASVDDEVRKARDTVRNARDTRPMWEIAAAAVLMLPMVAVFTLTAPRLD